MGITDMVSFLRQLRKKVPGAEQRPFVDLAKGFDTVNRKGLQQILEHLGCPQCSSSWSSSFIKISRAKSGYTRGMMFNQATEYLDKGDAVCIRYRFDGSLFNLRSLQAHTKTLEHLVRNLLFANDAAIFAFSEQALQRLSSCFAEAVQLLGLEV